MFFFFFFFEVVCSLGCSCILWHAHIEEFPIALLGWVGLSFFWTSSLFPLLACHILPHTFCCCFLEQSPKASDSNCIIEFLPDGGTGEDGVGCGQEYTDSVTASICVVTLSCSFSLVSLVASDCGTYLRAVVWLGSVCHMPWVSQRECALMCERDPRCLRRSSQFISVDTPPNSCPHLDTHSSSTHFHMLLPSFRPVFVGVCLKFVSPLVCVYVNTDVLFNFFTFFSLTY